MLSRRVLVTFLVILSLAAADLEQEPPSTSEDDPVPGIPGTLVNISTTGLLFADIPGVCDDAKLLVCTGCNSLRLCVGAIGTDIVCPTDIPYCNFGSTTDYCSADPIPSLCEAAVQDVPVLCTAVGILPDARNCRIYHGCTEVGLQSSIYRCPPGYVFNAALQLCALQNVFSPCTRLQCDADFIGHVQYGGSKRFYGFCDGTGLPPVMFRCPNRSNFAFISGSTFGECRYLCPGQGNFPNSNDPATYFQCFVANLHWTYNLVHCPAGLTFNARLQYCT